MKKLCLCLLLQLCVFAVAQESILDSSTVRMFYRVYRRFLANNYDGRSPEVPESVHRLRPGDIDVIAAMGDSIVVGLGLTSINFFDLMVENRGIVANIGGQETWRKYLTLPNILKEYNPKLIGYSYEDSISTEPGAGLNVAECGAMSKDMPYMAQHLVNKIKNDSRIDVNKHWKLITLMIGANDFCGNVCTASCPWSILEDHRKNLISALRILRDNLPRTIVFVLTPPNGKEIVASRRGTDTMWICYVYSMLFCPCMFGLKYADQRPIYYEIIERWQDMEEEITNYPEFNRNDFTAVFIPILKRSSIPLDENNLPDLSYLAYDYFHFNQKAHAIFANTLWNNIFEPVGNKSETLSDCNKKLDMLLCPTPERPFLATRENSRSINET
ncbi:phospholipase B1, membrane-associated-like isoform X2 [Frieseomelitta varia]|uniref:phospholipase B1, membrane-associated-like isoform X2 n=1 Tax=Frieseomelitta varia TaxID=561572 RepID=UPI001CB6873B|nr:phospholipase B1, membrane-associated-like isoform X2 [Frieseomelitta varia]